MSKTDCALWESVFRALPPPGHVFYIRSVSGPCSAAVALIAVAEQWKLIAAAVPSLCGCSVKKHHSE